MKRIGFICLIIGIVLISAIYWSRDRKPQKVLARINNYVMTVDDFKDEIKYSPYAGDEDIQRLLDLAIRKQILIQEAQRRGLDREKTFMETIERYWKQTLIKELLEEETSRIYKTVSKDKQAEALNDWTEGLYKKADIKIYEDVLQKLKENRKTRD